MNQLSSPGNGKRKPPSRAIKPHRGGLLPPAVSAKVEAVERRLAVIGRMLTEQDGLRAPNLNMQMSEVSAAQQEGST